MCRLVVLFLYTLTVLHNVALGQNGNKVNIPNQGTVVGHELKKNNYQKIIGYLGIPYAQPPVGTLRFNPPVTDPLPSWEGERNESFAPACVQVQQDLKPSEIPFLHLLDSKLSNNYSYYNHSEDCLYLNVFVPTIEGSPPPNGFATIIWFHPGNFTTGFPSIWNPHPIVYRKRIIVVTFAWRLNIMGFFTSMDGEAAGNYGLMDQQAAMQWVKNHIKLFNGNPDNISVMGYGTGAISIGIHMINPGSRGLFNKAIMMSGNLFDPSAVRYPKEDKSIVDTLSDTFGCSRQPTSLLLDCLRKIDADVLVERSSNVNWRPLIDKDLSNSTPPFLPEQPRTFFETNDYYKVPVLTGYTHMEQALEFVDDDSTANFTHDSLHQALKELVSGDIPSTNETDPNCIHNYDHMLDSVMFFYSPSLPTIDKDTYRKIIIDFMLERTYASSTVLLASYLSKDQPTYMYRFDMKPSSRLAIKDLPDWATVPHLFDLIYIWGVPFWKNAGWETRDKDISDTIMSLWTNFAKASNPTENSLYSVEWITYTKEHPGILIINTTFQMSTAHNLNYKAFEFWNNFYPKVKEISVQCCGFLGSSSFVNLHKLLFYLTFLTIISKFLNL